MAAQHIHSAVYPAIWDLGIVDKQDSSLVWCIINDTPECQVPIKVGPGGYSVLNHFRLWHADSLQFVENEKKHACCALPCNQGQRLALSIIPTFIGAVTGMRYGFWLDGATGCNLFEFGNRNLEFGSSVIGAKKKNSG